jgi:hypothetical protein
MVTLRTMRRIGAAIAAAQILVSPGATASAEEAPLTPATPRAAAAARIHHAPTSSAPQLAPLKLEARVDHPELLRWVGVVYRSARGKWRSVPLLRGGEAYAAVIPAEDVEAPGLSYTIEVEQLDGTRRALFASRAAPYPIQVIEDRMDARERAAYQRLSGRRSVATAAAEYVRFGATTGKVPIPCARGQESCKEGAPTIPVVDDQYYRVELGYTYRPLRTVAEFSIRGGVVRGTSLVPTLTSLDASKYKVGLNYGAPTIRFRLADAWHIEAEFLTSITEVGFSVGLGGALLIGDPYGSKLILGFETIGVTTQYFGTRFFSRVDIRAADRVRLAPIIEVTDMPHAEAFGVRLLGDVSVDVGAGFSLAVRGGYQARRSTSGGPSVGGSLSLAF